MTTNDVIFNYKTLPNASPTVHQKSVVTVEDVVNSTVFLAELLYAGQVGFPITSFPRV